MRSFNKIFCIGLWKTGTTSLCKSLKILGINALHNKKIYKTHRRNEDLANLVPLSTLDFQAFTDTPLEFDIWENFYPNSLYIDTYRELDPWLKSVRIHLRRNRRKFDEEKSTKSWYNWRKKIDEWFSNRPDVLKLSICHGDGWKKLCKFLETDIPKVSFPYRNKS